MKLTISLFVPGMPFNGESLNKHSLGGSETAGLCLARELAKLGHRVMMFCNTDQLGEYDGVTYVPASNFQQYYSLIPHDVCIIQRTPQLFSARTSAKLNILWNHDLAQGRHSAEYQGSQWNVNHTVVVSDWMKEQYKSVYGDGAKNIVTLRNGIDRDLFYPADLGDRDPYKLMYTARPERGLDVLLSKVFPSILQEVPQAKLYIAGYDNTVEQMAPFYHYIEHLIKQLGDSVVWLGPLNKQELYQHYATARAYIYPTPSTQINQNFKEVSCITALECMASGLPFIASDQGALAETCGKAGLLIPGDTTDPMHCEAIADAVVRVMTNDSLFTQLALEGQARIEEGRYDWSKVALDWDRMFAETFERVNKNPATLAQHFLNTNDIIAVMNTPSSDDRTVTEIHNLVHDKWGFAFAEGGMKNQYESIGKTHTDIYDAARSESRLGNILNWLNGHPEIKTILDWGCGLGVYAIEISNHFPDKTVVGVDIDKHAIQWANRYRDEHATSPDNLLFITTEEYACAKGVKGNFDCAIAAEILEHTTTPWTFLEQLESQVKSGGKIFLTVPYGPWEQMSYETYPHRAHLWNFEFFDIYDLIKDKSDISISSEAHQRNPQLDQPCGHNFISYTADGKRVHTIDLDRKIQVQNPPQTLSVNILAGPNCEQTLEWCLQSVLPVANEIVIGDAGMSDKARDIVEHYQPSYLLRSIKVVPVPNPLEHGFDEARNEIRRQSTMDWILWIDTDERLLEPVRVLKYLRANSYSGYGIRQHHFAVDTKFNPDMPVRLFRNNGEIKFFGRIHEHPETAINEGPGPVIVISDVHIAHVGYLHESIRRNRFWRNSPLLKKDCQDYPDRKLQKHFIIRDNMLLCNYLYEQSGGQATEEIFTLCREVVDLYREHFLGKASYVNVDSLQYYSNALATLGIGFDAGYQITANKHGNEEVISEQGKRFANTEELIKEITHRVESATNRFDQEYF